MTRRLVYVAENQSWGASHDQTEATTGGEALE
jgi:hypothetical protein